MNVIDESRKPAIKSYLKTVFTDKKFKKIEKKITLYLEILRYIT